MAQASAGHQLRFKIWKTPNSNWINFTGCTDSVGSTVYYDYSGQLVTPPMIRLPRVCCVWMHALIAIIDCVSGRCLA